MLKSLILAAALLAQVPTPAPQLWQLRDAQGVTWQHADRDYLVRWVADRNARLARPVRYVAPNYYQMLWGGVTSGCPGGNCSR